MKKQSSCRWLEAPKKSYGATVIFYILVLFDFTRAVAAFQDQLSVGTLPVIPYDSLTIAHVSHVFSL